MDGANLVPQRGTARCPYRRTVRMMAGRLTDAFGDPAMVLFESLKSNDTLTGDYATDVRPWLGDTAAPAPRRCSTWISPGRSPSPVTGSRWTPRPGPPSGRRPVSG
jgi:hypothetical protein